MKQYFPSVEEILDIIFAELPDGVYAKDRADDPDTDKRSYSSSELRAKAKMIADLYSNLKIINSDKTATTVTEEGLTKWEADYFQSAQDSALGFQIRKQNLIAKIRATGGIDYPYIKSIIEGVLAIEGLTFEILFYNGRYIDGEPSMWVFEKSLLELNTKLGIIDPLLGVQLENVPLDCSLDYAAAGITEEQMTEIQMVAYTYEVRIYGIASAETLALLDKQLTNAEPARSTHIITNGA